MASGKSDYYELQILDLIGGTAITPPATLYFALYTAAPTDSGGGTEVTGGGYVRLGVVNSPAYFGAATGSGKTNSTPLVWATPTASWGTVVAIGIFDAASGGNLLYWGTVTTSRLVDVGVPPRIEIGELVIREA